MAAAQSHCIEAARAAALASHSAGSLAAAAGLREAARLLRASEALARAATAALLALPHSGDRGPGSAAGAVGNDAKKKKRTKKKKGKEVEVESVRVDHEMVPAAGEAAVAAPASVLAGALSPAAPVFVPGQATRVLAARSSRERSPRGVRATAPASPTSSHHAVPMPGVAGAACFAEGQAVVFTGLVSRPDLLGKRGFVKSFDTKSSRFAVCVDGSSEYVRVRTENLQASIFEAGATLFGDQPVARDEVLRGDG